MWVWETSCTRLKIWALASCSLYLAVFWLLSHFKKWRLQGKCQPHDFRNITTWREKHGWMVMIVKEAVHHIYGRIHQLKVSFLLFLPFGDVLTPNFSPTSFTSTVKMSTPMLLKESSSCSLSRMSSAWGSSYCWPLVGTTASCLNNSQLLGLHDKNNPSPAAVVDQAEKTEQENAMEKYTFPFGSFE